MNTEDIVPIFQKYPVLFAYLFGSHAKGRATPKSDVDIAVFLDGTVPKEERRTMVGDLREVGA